MRCNLVFFSLLFSLPAGLTALGAEDVAPSGAPVPPAPAGAAATATVPQRVAPPDEEAVKQAAVLVHKVYAGRYAAKDDHGKGVLARMMLRHAEWHHNDPALEMVLLREAMRLAGEAKDYVSVLSVIDRLDAAFTGVVVDDERRKAFLKVTAKLFIAALVKLIDAPDDARSCVLAGRWLGPVAGRWAEALPVLIRASEDPTIQALANREVEPKSTSAQQGQVAQGWMDLAGKTSNLEERMGMLKHALALFQQALPGLQGVEQDKAKQAITTLLAKIPLDLDKVDWNALTAADWERIPAAVIQVAGKLDRTDTPIMLKDGESVRVVPHPTETWTFSLIDSSGPAICDWKGVEHSVTIRLPDNNNGGPLSITHRCGAQGHLYGSMLMWTDVNRKLRAGIITGPGKLTIGPSSDRMGEKTATGAMRVKIIAVEE